MSARSFHRDGSLPEGGDWVFVFGSNLAGRHGAGAARVAREQFGAVYGVGEGMTGGAYALPTLGTQFEERPLGLIAASVDQFIGFVRAHPELRFFVTRVGCGLAGRCDAEMAPLFADAPDNCSFAFQWREWIDEQPTVSPQSRGEVMPVCIPAAANKPYRPSNGTEGDMFYEQYCSRCRAEEDDDNPCMIYGNALFNDIGDPDYPAEWKYDGNGHPKCSAFVWIGPPALATRSGRLAKEDCT